MARMKVHGIAVEKCSPIFWFRLMQFHSTRIGHREASLVTPQLRETFYHSRRRKLKKQREEGCRADSI
jgi:hypothetical protein